MYTEHCTQLNQDTPNTQNSKRKPTTPSDNQRESAVFTITLNRKEQHC